MDEDMKKYSRKVNSSKMQLVLALFVSILLVACGSQESNENQKPKDNQILVSDKEQASEKDTADTEASEPTTSNPSGFFTSTAYQVPHDAPAPVSNASEQLTALATFAWQEFIALNWPSSYTPSAPTRGQPDTTKTPIDFANPNNSGELVWETYKHRVEIYPMADSNGNYPNYPTSYNSIPQYNYRGVDGGSIPECGAYNSTTGTWAVNNQSTLSSVNLFNNLDETSEINLCTLFTDGDPNEPGTAPSASTPIYMGLPKQPRRFIYEAKANQIMADYIVSNSYYKKSARSVAQQNTYTAVRDNNQGGIAPCPTPDPSNPMICFPPGVEGSNGSEGTILVKATWRQLTLNEYNSGRFLTSPIIRYRNPDPTNVEKFCYETIPATPSPAASPQTLPYGLVGLHIIHKTTNYPTFVFATFEQVDNLNSGNPNSSLFYYNRNNQAPINPGKQTITSRAHPIPDEVNDVTSQVHLQLRQLLAANQQSDSVWLYYKLIGVQGSATNPSDTGATDYFLANLVTETNEVLRSFSGTLDNNTGTINPQNTNLRKGHEAFVGGGCKGCHGNAQVGPLVEKGKPAPNPSTLIASDFSFITQNAPFDGVPDAINQPLLKTQLLTADEGENKEVISQNESKGKSTSSGY